MALLAACELVVVDTDFALYARFWAWIRLLKCWGALRLDDLRWTVPVLSPLGDKGLQASLQRTKASGPGKKVLNLVFWVSTEAFIAEPSWLAVS